MTVDAASHATQPGLTQADRAELTDLVHELAATLDEHRFDDLSALFAGDAHISTPGGAAEGREALVAQARRNHERYSRTQHHLTTVRITPDGDEADVRANAVAYLVREGPGPALTLGAVYRWRARRVPEGWQFARMEIERVWSVDGA